jgi:hypothetical protein
MQNKTSTKWPLYLLLGGLALFLFPPINIILTCGLDQRFCDAFHQKAIGLGVMGKSRSFVVSQLGPPASEERLHQSLIRMDYFPAPWFCMWQHRCSIWLRDDQVEKVVKNL